MAKVRISDRWVAYGDPCFIIAKAGGNHIEGLLSEAQRREEDELISEGYRFFNEENVAFAREALPAVWEAMKGDR